MSVWRYGNMNKFSLLVKKTFAKIVKEITYTIASYYILFISCFKIMTEKKTLFYFIPFRNKINSQIIEIKLKIYKKRSIC